MMLKHFLYRLKHRPHTGELPSNKSEWNRAVYVTGKETQSYYNKFATEHIPLSKDRLWTAYLHFFMPKTSCFRSPFNGILRKFVQHGLVQKWINDYAATGSKMNNRDQQILKLEHIQGIFYICFGIYFVAFVVFLMELLLVYIRRPEAYSVQQLNIFRILKTKIMNAYTHYSL